MENIYASLSPFYMPDMSTKVMELNAIWLEKKLMTANETTARITPGMLVKVQGGRLVDCIGDPTHLVTKCLGTVQSTMLEFVLIDIITREETSLKLN